MRLEWFEVLLANLDTSAIKILKYDVTPTHGTFLG